MADFDAYPQENGNARQTGIVKGWTEKGFGFITKDDDGEKIFCHIRETPDRAGLIAGLRVSFIFESDDKGGKAKNVVVVEAGQQAVEEPEEREMGIVKSVNEEKGFAFIAPASGGDDLFSHKKDFIGAPPQPRMPVSFVRATTEKGDAAKKVKDEDEVPEIILSDEGREFGKVKHFNTEKGFGHINWKDEDPAIVFDKQCNGLTLEKDQTVSFVMEEGEKGPIAKDIRLEDPARVARVTAKVHYGKVESYWDPTDAKPTNGYGFITPLSAPGYGQPKKYYFHMSELVDPDEDGGIEPTTGVSFIVTPSKSGKGFQACAVTIADPPEPKKEEERKEEETGLEEAAAGWGISDNNGWGNGDTNGHAKAAESVSGGAATDGWGMVDAGNGEKKTEDEPAAAEQSWDF